MRTVMVLGNCVVERLQCLLQASPALRGQWVLCPSPPVHSLRTSADTDALAHRALACDRVFTQPLYSYGACNTERLRAQSPLDKVVLFSAPNFEAYFPDVLHVAAQEEQRFPPPLEWHSRIFAQGYAAKLPVEEVAALYPHHALFRKESVARALEETWANYEKREQGVDLGTLKIVRERYASEALFHTWNHPAEIVLSELGALLLKALGVEEGVARAEARVFFGQEGQGFGFNQWPIITRHHAFFSFAGREYFCVAGQEVSLEDAAAGYYTYYDFHPQTLAAVLQHCAATKRVHGLSSLDMQARLS